MRYKFYLLLNQKKTIHKNNKKAAILFSDSSIIMVLFISYCILKKLKLIPVSEKTFLSFKLWYFKTKFIFS